MLGLTTLARIAGALVTMFFPVRGYMGYDVDDFGWGQKGEGDTQELLGE